MISGELGIPETHNVGKGAPLTVDVAAERLPVADQGRDVEQCALDVGHVHAEGININGGHVQLMLIVNLLLSEGLRESNDHGSTAHTRFHGSDELLLLDEVRGIVHEHFGYGLTDWVGREELTGLVVVDFKAVIQSAEHIGWLLLHAFDEHAEHGRELLNLFRFVLLDDGEVLRLARCFVPGIGQVAEGNRRELDKMSKYSEGVMAIGKGADGMLKRGKIVPGRLWSGFLRDWVGITPPCQRAKKYPTALQQTVGAKGTLSLV